MNKYITILLLFLLFSKTHSAQDFGRGLIKVDVDTTKLFVKEIPNVRGSLPSSYSLKNYTPSPGNQGNFGSCTSWASAYCALTICQRIQKGQNVGPFDPINLHNRLKALYSLDPCSDGNNVAQAAALLVSNGCPVISNSSGESCGYRSSGNVYENKLYSCENLSVSVSDFKYVLSQEKSPIVISANYFKNGWESNSNLVSGVWNGKYDATTNEGHAMVIIGYDDYKSGGSFYIQNSWGTGWGENGFMWLRYQDLAKMVYAATQFKPNLNYSGKEISDYDNVEQSYRFYNNCSLTTYVSLSQNIGDNWITRGWYAVTTGGYIDLPIGDRNANNVYWMATAINNGEYIDWVDNVNGTQMCFDRVNAFTIYDNANPSCPDVASFYLNAPDSRQNLVITTLGCPNVATRGLSVELSAEQMNTQMKSENAGGWDGYSALMDAYSSQIIYPFIGNNDELVYKLVYLKNGAITHFEGGVDELMKIESPKFITELNASYYLNSIQSKE